MTKGRSTKIISMIQLIRTSRLSMKNSLSQIRLPISHADVAGVHTKSGQVASLSHNLCLFVDL